MSELFFVVCGVVVLVLHDVVDGIAPSDVGFSKFDIAILVSLAVNFARK